MCAHKIIAVKESLSELKALQRSVKPHLRKRVSALILIRQSPAMFYKEIGRVVGAVSSTVARWLRQYEKYGTDFPRHINGEITGELIKSMGLWLKKHPEPLSDELFAYIKNNYTITVTKQYIMYRAKREFGTRFRWPDRMVSIKIKEPLRSLEKLKASAGPGGKTILNVLITLKKEYPITVKSLVKKSGKSYPTMNRALQLYKALGLKNLPLWKAKMPEFRFPVKESMDELNGYYADSLPVLKPRVKMLVAMKEGYSGTKIGFSVHTGISEPSVRRWHALYLEGGIEKLLTYAPKRKDIITGPLHSEIRNKLKGGCSFGELHAWLIENTLPDLKEKTLHAYLYKHGIQPKRAVKPNINVAEDVEYLRTLHRKLPPKRKGKVAMLIAIKKNPLLFGKELARKIGCNPRSVDTWSRQYATYGLDGLLTNRK